MRPTGSRVVRDQGSGALPKTVEIPTIDGRRVHENEHRKHVVGGRARVITAMAMSVVRARAWRFGAVQRAGAVP